MIREARVRAPAKLNLFLEVLGRRPDGYHEVETVFQAVDLADELRVRLRPRPAHAPAVVLRCEPPVTARPEENLAYRAAAALVDPGGPWQVELRLRKVVPPGSGLGGGSSDAAAVLRVLAPWVAPGTDLPGLAARLGADVPFFLEGGTALGRGTGAEVRPVPATAAFAYVVALPPLQVSTRAAYGRVDLTAPRRNASVVVEALAHGDPRALAEGIFNRLEATTLAHCPEVAAVRETLTRAAGRPFHLTGSGAALFAVCPAGWGEAATLALRLGGVLPDVTVRAVRSLPRGGTR